MGCTVPCDTCGRPVAPVLCDNCFDYLAPEDRNDSVLFHLLNLVVNHSLNFAIDFGGSAGVGQQIISTCVVIKAKIKRPLLWVVAFVPGCELPSTPVSCGESTALFPRAFWPSPLPRLPHFHTCDTFNCQKMKLINWNLLTSGTLLIDGSSSFLLPSFSNFNIVRQSLQQSHLTGNQGNNYLLKIMVFKTTCLSGSELIRNS